MERESLTGKWNEWKGKIKQRWGQLTDDDLTFAEGNRDELIGRIQQRYGGAKQDISRELDNLLR